jgi:hypothetical protein
MSWRRVGLGLTLVACGARPIDTATPEATDGTRSAAGSRPTTDDGTARAVTDDGADAAALSADDAARSRAEDGTRARAVTDDGVRLDAASGVTSGSATTDGETGVASAVAGSGLAIGDAVRVDDTRAIDATAGAIAAAGCLPTPVAEGPTRFGPRDRPWSGDVGRIVAIDAGCPAGEVVQIAAGAGLSTVASGAVVRAPAGCPEAVAAMRSAVLPAWERCLARARHRGSDLAEVQVGIDAAGVVTRVDWRGGTGWGPPPVRCMLAATRRLVRDGSECPGLTIRLSAVLQPRR